MRVAIFGKSFTKDARPFVKSLYEELSQNKAEIKIYKRLNRFLEENCDLSLALETFSDHNELVEFAPDCLITLGGDGTILDAATLVRDSGIPILGVNIGRLGFLSNVSKEQLQEAVQAVAQGNYTVEERNVVELNTSAFDLDLNFALNEVTVSRKDTTAMVSVHVWINDKFLNTYWADGLIIATPTGSTGYSLSCGGPIIMPGSDSFVITPIAPHNLNVRPFVIPNSYKIKLKVESRERQFLVSLDSRIYSVENGSELEVELGSFTIKMIKTHVQNFAETLRNKLLWGLDKRN